MSLRARICLAGLGLSAVWAWVGQVPSAEAQGGGRGPEEHPLLTENEYQLVAEQSQKRAASRNERKAARLTQLTARLAQVRNEASSEANTALEAQLSGVVARLEVGRAPVSDEERWSRNHGRRMMLRGLWGSYGKQLYQPAVVAEFDAHAWRTARLERARQVAASEPDVIRRERLVADVDGMVAAESERHRAALKQLLQPVSPQSALVHTAAASVPSPSAQLPSAPSPSAQPSAGGPNP